MKKYYGYIRVSTNKQDKSASPEAQKEAILAYANQNGFEIVQWFREAKTAAKRGRPLFTTIIKSLKRGEANGLIIHKLDRSARNAEDWLQIGRLVDAGVDVQFVVEKLDLTSRSGRLTADMLAVIAADFIRNLREETRKGLDFRLNQGIYPFKAPIGYLDNGGGKLKTIDPLRGPLVKRAFELYASGQYSIRALQAEMQRLGLRTDSGKQLSKGCIEKMLSNPFYTGVMRIRRSGLTFRGLHKPLISTTIFETVQDVKAGKAVKKVTRHNHTYRGLFRCQGCGNSMIGERQKGHVYYRCQQTNCPTNCIREKGLIAATFALLDQVELPENAIAEIEAAVEKWVSKPSGTVGLQAATLQFRQLEGRLEQLTDALIDRLIDKETFNCRKEAMLIEQAALEKKLADARKNKINPQMVRLFLERMKNLAEHYNFAPPAEKREIVEIATSNRVVWDKNAYIEPSKWLKPAQETLSVFFCGHSRPKSRRLPKLQNEHIEALIEAARSEEFARLNAIVERCEQLQNTHKDKPPI